ncbi:MAG: hypothetical protein ABI461_09260 [Polyangiaceae bacterium]
MRGLVATCVKVAAVFGALAALSNDARAAAPEEKGPVKTTENGAERRSGAVFGTSVGLFGLGSASGTPNNANQYRDSRYYSSSGPMLGNSFSLFIEGALADPLSVGFIFYGAGYQNGDFKASASGLGLRLDLYPFAVCKCFKPFMRDLGLVEEFGIGGVQLTPKNDDKKILAEGTQTFINTGFFYDMKVAKLLGGHLSLGPEIDYTVVSTTTAEAHGLGVAFRVAFNGGP